MPTTEHIHLPLYTDEETPDLSTTGHYNHAMEILDANIGELEEKDAELAEDIADEREARIAGDTALEGKVAAEAKARADADTALEGKVAAEAKARADSDTALEGKVAAEAKAREAADTALEGKVAAETKAREAADAAITTSIGTKADSSALEKEVSDRKAADTALEGKVAAETKAREAADTALEGKVAAETKARADADTALGGKVAAETKAREAADAAITTRIGTKADSSALEKEVSDRKAADAATKNYVDTAIAAIPTGGSSAIALIDADTGTAAEIYAATQSAWPNCVLRHGEALYLPANRNDFGYGFFGTPCGTNVPGYAVNSVGADEYNVLNMTGRATWGQIEQS